MSYKLGNRVKMTVSGTPGTGTISLGSAVSGFLAFGDALSNTDTCPYVIEDAGNAWEIGVGTYTVSGNTLARTTVTASSAGGTTKISATSAAQVYLAPLASDLNAGTVNGIIKANGTGTFSAAAAGTDYVAPGGSAGAITATGFKETKVTMAANAIDLTAGNYFSKTISGATTLTISGTPSSGTASSFVLDLTNGGSATITWFATIKWAGGTAPTWTTSGRDVIGFFTHDGGTTWNGVVMAKDIR